MPSEPFQLRVYSDDYVPESQISAVSCIVPNPRMQIRWCTLERLINLIAGMLK